jgi:hypothetical protein
MRMCCGSCRAFPRCWVLDFILVGWWGVKYTAQAVAKEREAFKSGLAHGVVIGVIASAVVIGVTLIAIWGIMGNTG